MAKKKLDFWKDVEEYDKYIFGSKEGKDRIEEIEKYFPEFKKFLSKRILDVACGTGLFSFGLKKGYNVVGVLK